MATVLLIDDDGFIRDLTAALLERQGHHVVRAENGRKGLDAFHDQPVDLVVTDLVMPVQEGIETIMAIRKLDQQTPILAMSSGIPGTNMDFLPAALALGASATIRKPFSPAGFCAAIDDLLLASVP